MIYKSETQPLCRYCAKAISKRTETVFFGRNVGGTMLDARLEQPQSRAEAQAVLNQQVVSVHWRESVVDGAWKRAFIDRVSIWDGESYDDEFFCSGSHARQFGYAAARANNAMPVYNRAIKEQNDG